MIKKVRKVISVVCAAGMIAACLAGCGSDDKADAKSKEASNSGAFAPSLDTEKATTLEVAGFFGNFEALDQVVNDFNEIYPNVTITYEQTGGEKLAEYLDNNQYIDIFMTNAANVLPATEGSGNVLDYCLDLSKEDIDVSDIDPDILKVCSVDGRQARLPFGRLMCGLVVNKTLLKNEGLNVPTNYKEFIEVCEALKQKGYTPIQSARYHACSDLMLPMGMNIIENDEELIQKVKAGDDSYVDSLKPVYEKLEELIDKGYIDNSVNETYPDDNYDGAIMTFFQGKVPFWVCNTEHVSGMKKRESKSEEFTKNPFDYEFINAPVGDDGVYAYEEAWYGFSVSKNSDNVDYAVEFMRFLAQKDELNKIASVKGVPSVTIDNDDERYNSALNPDKCVSRCVFDPELTSANAKICAAAHKMGFKELQNADEAVESMKE